MDVNDPQLGAAPEGYLDVGAKDGTISAMLITPGKQLLIAQGKCIKLFEEVKEKFKVNSELDFGWYIEDMTMTEGNQFAFTVPGFFRSSIHQAMIKNCKINTDGIPEIITDRKCAGIAYQSGYFFVSYSGFAFMYTGYIKMMDKKGSFKKIFTSDNFSKSLPRLCVDRNSRILVSDQGNDQMKIIKLDAFSEGWSFENEEEECSVNDISIRKDGKFFLAIGGRQHGVLLITPNGNWFSKIIKKKALPDIPSAICYMEDKKRLLVASKKSSHVKFFCIDYPDILQKRADIQISIDH